MFDEVDEGTAVFKVTSPPPIQGHFVGYEGLPGDWYLRLVGEAARRLHAPGSPSLGTSRSGHEPRNQTMLKCSTSLWSADLANLAAEIHRVEPYSERFHLDVADGHYVPALLFFPDLVAAIRRHATIPLEVHLMTNDPLIWVGPFSDAGADGFIVCLDSHEDLPRTLHAVKQRRKFVGVSIRIEEEVEQIEPYLKELDLVTILGTKVGIKGAAMDPRTPARVRQARRLIAGRGLSVEVEVDGGIRRQSVPLLHAAGADWIVPGSLMFGEDPLELRRWLASLA